MPEVLKFNIQGVERMESVSSTQNCILNCKILFEILCQYFDNNFYIYSNVRQIVYNDAE